MLRWGFIQAKQKRFLRLGVVTVILLLLYLMVYSPVSHIGYRANYFNLGNAYRDLGQPEKALYHYGEALKVHPGFYYAYFNKGKVLAKMGRGAEARTALRKALKLARGNNDKLNIVRIQRQLSALKE